MGAVVVVGIGELGAVFSRGFLKLGHAVFPVTRSTRMAEVASTVPEPELALITVGEADLDAVLGELPPAWRGRVGLVQNELRAASWLGHGLVDPSVAVVWFEKKPSTLVKELLPTLVAGPRAGLLRDALAGLGVATRSVAGDAELDFELARKNLYILTTNLAGLRHGGTVSELWERHRDSTLAVAREVAALERALSRSELSEAALLATLPEAIAADPAHAATGRSAPARLARALAHAARLGLAVPELRALAESAP